MIKIGKVIGDVIEAGGVKNVTNNYYEKSPATEEGEDRVMADDELPEQLKGERAEELMERRIIDRILEVCVPLCFDGPNLRQKKAEETKERLQMLTSR